MKPRTIRLALAAAILVVAGGCDHDVDTSESSPEISKEGDTPVTSSSPDTGVPDMPERYRKGLLRAFANAGSGESPTMACTSVVARAAGNPVADGALPHADDKRAFELCYVDVGARYIQALIDQLLAGSATQEQNCAKIVSYVVIARASLGSFAGNVQLDVSTLDGRLLERVRKGMASACPDQIEALSGYR